MRRLDASSVDENLQKWGDSNRVSSPGCRSAWSPGGARRASTYRQPARSEATRVRVGVLVHGPRDNSSCSAGLNPAVSSADRRSSQLVRASHWEQAIAQPLGRSPAQGRRVVLARHPAHAGRRAACGHLASSDAEPLPAQLPHYAGVDWSASSLTPRGRREILRAVVEIERRADIRKKLGDNAPMISASALHPWIWEGARSLWQSGHVREAVRAASVKLNAELQNKLGRRDLSEQALFQEAFSADDPQPGRSRLRLSRDDGGKTARSVRRGIVALAEGCYAAVRNPVSHDEGTELDEQVALEQLAAFSLLARWVDDANAVSAR